MNGSGTTGGETTVKNSIPRRAARSRNTDRLVHNKKGGGSHASEGG